MAPCSAVPLAPAGVLVLPAHCALSAALAPTHQPGSVRAPFSAWDTPSWVPSSGDGGVCPLSSGLCLAFTGPRQISVPCHRSTAQPGSLDLRGRVPVTFLSPAPGGAPPTGRRPVLPSGTGKGRACALCPGTVSEPKPVFPVRCSESLGPPLLRGSWSGRCGSTEWPRTPCEEGGVGFEAAGPQGGPSLLPGGPWPARLSRTDLSWDPGSACPGCCVLSDPPSPLL